METFGQHGPKAPAGLWPLLVSTAFYCSAERENNEFNAPEPRPTLEPRIFYRFLELHPLKGHNNSTYPMGLPWWRSGWESACQCRGHGFKPWSGKIPHAAEQLGPWATTTEPVRLELVLCNKRGPCTAMKSGPRLPQLEKALTQKLRPNTAKNK